MVMSERLKEMTIEGASEAEITEVARSEGMVTLREDGLHKVRAGVTSHRRSCTRRASSLRPMRGSSLRPRD